VTTPRWLGPAVLVAVIVGILLAAWLFGVVAAGGARG
jgi:hypothetical protein